MPIDQYEDQSAEDSSRSESPGSVLQRVRLERGLDEKAIADHLHITVHYVKAIEGDKYEKLPGVVFAKGYLKSYAKFLGLNPEEILASYSVFLEAHQQTGVQEQLTERRASRNRNAQWGVASVVCLVVLIGAALYFSGPEQPESAESARTTTPANTIEPRPQQAVQSPAVTEQIATPTENQVEVVTPDSVLPSAQDLSDLDSASAPAESVPELEPDSQMSELSNDVTDEPFPADESVADTLAVSSDAEEPETEAPVLAAEEPEDAPPVSSQPVASAEQGASAEPGAAAEQESRPEDLTDISVLEGDNGERVIAVNAQGEDLLRISFSGESWVEVNDGEDRQIYRDLREPGDVLEISGHAPFNILLGDAPFTTLNFNGADIDVSDNIRIDNSARLTVGL